MAIKSIEQYLRDCIKEGIIDFSIRAQVDDQDKLSFYIHPDGKDGDTQDYLVIGDILDPISNWNND